MDCKYIQVLSASRCVRAVRGWHPEEHRQQIKGLHKSFASCKLKEIAEAKGTSISALSSFIVTEYLMEHYQEYVAGTEKEDLSIWEML